MTVILFKEEQDARRVYEVLGKRFARYNLKLHEEKTRLVYYGPPKGEKEPESFDFLGFTHYIGKSRRGRWVPKRKTAKKRLKRALLKLREWMSKNMHAPVKEQWETLNRKLKGHYNFYGVTFNSRSLSRFFEEAKKAWRFVLNRRSRKKPKRLSEFRPLTLTQSDPLFFTKTDPGLKKKWSCANR